MNSSSIIKIVLYSVLIVILLSIMIFGLFKREFIFSIGDYEKTELFNETYELEDLDKLDISMVSTDISIKNSEDDNVHVIIYGKENRKDRYSIGLDEKTLKVEEKSYSSFCFGFCFYNEEVVVYLPENYNKDINIKGTSSDVVIFDSYDSKMNIQTVSGEVKLEDANDLVVKTTSGDIVVGSASDIDAKSTSGEVNIRSGRHVKVNTTSGDINVDEAEKSEITSTSGDVRIGKSGNVNLSTMSGDIAINELNVDEESVISSTSGEVTISKINDCYVETKTTSGDVRIDNNDRKSENTLKIKTTSGDIVVR